MSRLFVCYFKSRGGDEGRQLELQGSCGPTRLAQSALASVQLHQLSRPFHEHYTTAKPVIVSASISIASYCLAPLPRFIDLHLTKRL